MLHTVDFVMPIQKAMTPELCTMLIDKFEQNADKHVIRDEEHFKFAELNLNQTEGFETETEQVMRISQYLMAFYKKEMNVRYFPQDFTLEQLRLKRYDPNGVDQFDWHTDVGNIDSSKRFMVIFFYLNDVAAGGETCFSWDCQDLNSVRVKPEQGQAVMFPPFWTHPHKGMAPISGPKYILSTYAHYL